MQARSDNRMLMVNLRPILFTEMTTAMTDPAEKTRILKRITLQGMVLDLLLSGLKVVVGWFGNSYALIVDGIHSLTDAASDVMVVLVAHYAHQAPDSDHPYGHGKIETLGTVALGTLLIAVAGAIAFDSVDRVLQGESQAIPTWPVLLVAGLSIVSKEWIYRYTLHYGRLYRSDLIIANAWHSRSDALSSVIVLVAAAGAMAGYPWLDAVAAGIVAVMIGKIGWDLAWKSAKELVETAVPAEDLARYRTTLEDCEGVRDVHFLRGRSVGGDVVVDMHLRVDPRLTVSEGHHVGLCATNQLRSRHPEISDTTVHVDAEDDGPLEEQVSTYATLPQRAEILQILEALRTSLAVSVRFDRVNLHYLRGHIDIEILIRDELANAEKLEQDLRHALKSFPWHGGIKVWSRASKPQPPSSQDDTIPPEEGARHL